MYQYYAVPRDLFFNRGVPSDTLTIFTVPLAGVVLPDSVQATGVDTVGIVLTWHLRRPEAVRTIQVYRSASQDTGFVQIGELPPDATRFADIQVEPMRMYYYRLGLTGLRGTASPRTASVFGYLSPALPPTPPLAVQADTTAKGFRISWSHGGDQEIAGYRVYRTDAPIDSLTDSTAMLLVSPLLPATDTVFVDSSAGLGSARSYTWAVRAVGPGGLASGYSNPAMGTRVTLRPLPVPDGLSGYAGTSGVVLAWNDMTGADPLVQGYQVLRRAGSRAAWDTLTRAPLGRQQNGYVDTTAQNGTWQYTVLSVGVTGARSALSVAVTLERTPAPPPPPAGIRLLDDSGAVLVAWDAVADSTAMVRIYRYARGGKPERIGEVRADALEYPDRSAKPGVRYYYYLTTVVNGVEGPGSGERTVVGR